MATVTALGNNIEKSLKRDGELEHAGAKIANTVQGYEDQLLKLYADNADGKNEAEIQQVQIKYQRALRVMQLFSDLVRNAHEMMMRIIGNLRLS